MQGEPSGSLFPWLFLTLLFLAWYLVEVCMLHVESQTTIFYQSVATFLRARTATAQDSNSCGAASGISNPPTLPKPQESTLLLQLSPLTEKQSKTKQRQNKKCRSPSTLHTHDAPLLVHTPLILWAITSIIS